MSSDRRGFLGQFAALALTTPVILSEAKDPSDSRRSSFPAAAWDLSWIDQLDSAKHRAVFDATLITSGLAPGHVDLYFKNYKEIYNVDERDMRAVLVVRHEAVPMLLNDAFWQKYQLGQKLRLNDPATSAPTTRNYFGLTGSRPIPELTTLENLKARGVIILGCHKALMSVAGIMAQSAGVAAEAVQAEAKAAVLPFVTLMPSGIFAVMRAQEAGCQYVRST